MTSVKVRFAPSPTGLLHLGNFRTALFNQLFASNQQGKVLLRIEDTDQQRSKLEYEHALCEDLKWLEFTWDEGPHAQQADGPYHQAKRQTIYQDYLQRLLASGQAYPCFCKQEELALIRKRQLRQGHPPRYPGTCRQLSPEQVMEKKARCEPYTLRFRVPKNITVEYTDLVHGAQSLHSKDISDFILQRHDGLPTFMFANALDDALMGVTHVLRGEDHLTNTPRQILLLQTLGLSAPHYAHIALLLASDRNSPLSKRDNSLSLQDLHQQGYLPLAIQNYLARLGHYYKDDQLLSLGQLAERFALAHLQKAAAKFDPVQLRHWQKCTVMQLNDTEFWQWLGDDITTQIPKHKRDLFAQAIRPNVCFPAEAKKWADICFSNHLLPLAAEQASDLAQVGSRYFSIALNAYQDEHTPLAQLIRPIKNALGLSGKTLYHPLRLALTGNNHGPELVKLLELLPADLVKTRLQHYAHTL